MEGIRNEALEPPANGSVDIGGSIGVSFEQQQRQPHALDRCNGKAKYDHQYCLRERLKIFKNIITLMRCLPRSPPPFPYNKESVTR